MGQQAIWGFGDLIQAFSLGDGLWQQRDWGESHYTTYLEG